MPDPPEPTPDGQVNSPRSPSNGAVDRREHERRLQALFTHSLQFMGLLSPDGTLLDANDAALAFVGARRADVIGRPFWETPWWRGSEHGQRRLRAAVAEAAAGRRPRFEAEHLDKDGVAAHVDFSLSPATDTAGRVEYLIAEGRDITDVTRAHEETHARHAELLALAHHAEAEREAALVQVRALVAAAAGTWEWDAAPTFERWLASVHADDRPAVLARLEAMRQAPGDDTWEDEHRVVHPDGTVVWVHSVARAERDSHGHVFKMIGLDFDITARKEAAERARVVEERLARFVAETADVLYSMRVDGQIVGVIDFVAPAAERIYGRPSHAFVENPNLPMEVVHPDDQPRIRHALDVLFTTGQFEETYRITRPDGGVRWLHDRARAVRNDAGDVVRIDGIARDVTERKVAEAQIRTAETLSQSIIESAVDGVVVIDERGMIERVNPSACRLFGYSETELVGHNVQVLMPAPSRERHDDYLAHYRATGEKRVIGIGREVEGCRKDGSTFPLFLSVSEMWLPTGRRFAGIVHDLTALKASEAEVTRSHEALQVRATQLEHQTHQLRRLASEVTLAETRAREEMAKTLHDGLQQQLFSAAMKLDRAVQRGVDDTLVARARDEVRDAIAAARSLSLELHPPALRAGDLPAALAWLAERMRERYRLTVDAVVDPDANPPQQQVRQLLFESVRELLFNTVKYAHVDRAALELAVRDDVLSITVSDAGVGFDAAARLGPAREYHGGLGLFAIRERVTLLGGQVHLDSAPGRGTRVSLTVPFSGREPQQEPSTLADGVVTVRRRAADVPTVAQPLRILLVDDHALVREGLRELLAQHPEFVVVGEAADGHEALRLARTRHPDVVLMDVSMPGMDGIETTRRLRAELPDVRVYGLSTQEPTRGRHPIEDAGAVGYFMKATSTQPLMERLKAEHERGSGIPR